MINKIDEIKDRLAKATSEPWRILNANLKNPKCHQIAGPVKFASEVSEDVVHFVGNSPSDIQYLLDRVDKFECALDDLERVIERLKEMQRDE